MIPLSISEKVEPAKSETRVLCNELIFLKNMDDYTMWVMASNYECNQMKCL